MFRFLVITIIVSCIGTAIGQVENRLYQHNLAYQDPNDPNLPNLYYYTPNAFEKTFIIHHGIEGETFEFEAVEWDGSTYVGRVPCPTTGAAGLGHAECRVSRVASALRILVVRAAESMRRRTAARGVRPLRSQCVTPACVGRARGF